MSLSEREQQLLDQMEQALYAEDPRFASQMQSAATRRSHTRHLIGLVGVLAGLGLVLLGVNTTWIVGAAGFLVMVAALAYAFAPPRKQRGSLGVVHDDGSVGASRHGGKAHKQGRSRKPQSGTFMERLEDRWDRRRGGW